MKQNFEHWFCIAPTIATAHDAAKNMAVKNLPIMEFHVSKTARDRCQFDAELFATTGNVILANFTQVRLFAKKINDTIDPVLHPEQMIKAGQLNAMGLIDEIFHYICFLYRQQIKKDVFKELFNKLETALGEKRLNALLLEFTKEFPPAAVFKGTLSAEDYLQQTNNDSGISNRVTSLEEMVLLHLANENPAFSPFKLLFNDEKLAKNPSYAKSWILIQDFFKTQPEFGPNNNDLITMLREPIVFSPNSLKGQLDYIRTYWSMFLGEWLRRLLSGLDMIQEEEKPGWSGHFSGPPPMDAYSYDSLSKEYERFSPDRDWMPRVVLMAKTILVWLHQLSEKYKRPITRLDHIPDEELDLLAQQGFTGIWLIGIWERSFASQRIKQINGNPEAAASAYSLDDYEIAQNLGGWDALDNLRKRLWYRGIRLASDMVPNHTGMDARWIVDKPDLFIQRRDCPFPTYTFNGENLSLDSRVGVYLEDHYYEKSDCSVVFKRVDHHTGDVRYIYHGNDGTGMPWNDTAQIDFLNPVAREEVIQKIMHVARNFPIIRFDAAMVLAKKHIKRLWYPEPGTGGDIATRSEYSLTNQEFEQRIPEEFWREVVDRCAAEIPDTLLLAEAFWMMEGYFVRTLGMHRVYNSAFMNMLKKEENEKYRMTVKNTLEFDPQVLRRFVNFMNNPDEETAVAQFGKGDKYFGVCTLMVTMPGLPMFGHGQIEGFEEKYGMEFQKAYWNEKPDQDLIERHKREIFPLMKKRYLFAEIDNFYFFDVWDAGRVNENVFAYSNAFGKEKAIVFYNNTFNRASGWIKQSCNYLVKTGDESFQLESRSLADALQLSREKNTFCIFQEQRSHLWYIRTCQEIHNNGLYVHLNGFETQILMNINQVTDDETGKYRTLYTKLAGAGVKDIDIALQEIFLKDLYKALTNFATPEFFTSFAQLCLPEVQKKALKIKIPSLTALLKTVQSAAYEYYKMLDVFIAGNYGSSTIFDRKKAGKKVPSDIAWKNFTARLDRILKIKQMAEKPAAGANPHLTELVKSMYEGMLARPNSAEVLASYAILYSVRDIIGDKATAQNTHDLINLWCLDRKIRETLMDMGIPSRDLYANFKTILEVTPYDDVKAKKSNHKEIAYMIAHALVSSPNAAQIIGLNKYEDIVWFNKEKLEDAIWATTIIHAVNTKTDGELLNIREVLKHLDAGKQKAEYKAEQLLAALYTEKKTTATVKKASAPAKKASPAQVKAKATGKPPASSAKTPAKKTDKSKKG